MLFAPGKDFVPRGPRDCPRIGPEGNLESPPTDALTPTFFIWSLPELLYLEANWAGRLFGGKWGLADWALQKCPSFPGPNLPGPNLRGPDFPGLNLPKKSPLGSVCLDPSSKWRGFRFRYWFLSWCLPYSFGILFLNLSLSLFPYLLIASFSDKSQNVPPHAPFVNETSNMSVLSSQNILPTRVFHWKTILVVDWFYFKYTGFRSTVQGSLDNAD